ncbi:MAG: tetratricopeptide repeat protein, partial [Thermoguttaceae bacterium]
MCIVFSAIVVYFPALGGDFVLDDAILLTANPLIKAPDGLYWFWCSAKAPDYWPVANTSLWIEWRLWGMNPTGYHVTNLILHISAALLLWMILRKLCIPGAFFAALIFAVHPVNVESVAWIAQRKGMLAMIFGLLSVWWYLEYLARARL